MPLLLLRSINKAVHHLRAGNLVIYPTETAYALGADAANSRAVRKIFKVKGRRKNKALPLIAGTRAMAHRYGRFSALMKRLAKIYWPGPLTIVVPVKDKIVRGALGNDKTAALRVSSHALARSLSKRLGRPIVATSANLSGKSNIYAIGSLKKSFARAPEPIYLISGGTLPRRKPSTIVAYKNGKLIVLRRGAISPKL